MSDQDLSFGTAVLTSKSPREAAAIIPNCLTSSQNLVERCLLIWFNNYHSLLQKQNQELKVLYDQGSSFFKASQNYQEFGSFNKTWNCLLNSVQTEIHANEANYKSIKLDIIGPLKDIITNDVRYSELIVNSQELQEVANNVATNVNGAEYQWNLKAPQTFENLQNFKKYEKQLLFDIILNYFNSNNQRFNKNLSNSEDSVDYLVSNFKIDREMDEYLKFLLRSEFQPVPIDKSKGSSKSNPHSFHIPKKIGSAAKSDNHSMISDSSSTHKKKSKLKSKVGSIFGKKSKKPSKMNKIADDSIPESPSGDSFSHYRTSDTVSQTHTRNDSLASRGTSIQHSVQRHSNYQQPIIQQQQQQQQQQQKQSENVARPTAQYQQAESKSNTVPENSIDDISQSVRSNEVLTPIKVLQPKEISSNELPQIQDQAELAQPNPYRENSPNVIKFDSDSSSDEEVGNGNVNKRMSMLQRHDLAPDGLNESRSIQSSPGKYSFVVGDDKAPIKSAVNEDNFQELQQENNAIFNNEEINKEYSDLAINSTNRDIPFISEDAIEVKDKVQVPPPPPPARKAHPSTQTGLSDELPPATIKGRRDIHSQIFHNLPNARESFIQPPTLVSQDTGNSLLKNNDYFKHFDSTKLDNVQGLTSSIAEVINASFKDGKLINSQIIGEIVFNYRSINESGVPKTSLIKIPGNFDKVILNRSVIEEENDQGVYKLAIAPIMAKSLGALKYLCKLNESQIPFFIQQIWKFEDHQSSLMINLTLNKAYNHFTLTNVVISVALDQSVESTSASSRPQGSFNTGKNRITWRFAKPIQLTSEHPEEKLIARFLTNGKGSEHESGIQVKFQADDIPLQITKVLNSDVNLGEVPTVRSLTSGNYSGHYL